MAVEDLARVLAALLTNIRPRVHWGNASGVQSALGKCEHVNILGIASEYGKNCIAVERHIGVSACSLGFRVLLASTEVLRSTVLPTLQFCGANAEYTMASAGMIAPKPKRLNRLGWCSSEQRQLDTAYQPHFE